LAHPLVDYVIGSLHHARGVPIDYDAKMYSAAVAACGGSEVDLYCSYLDEQFEMLRAIRPALVGHFDLPRLLSSEPGRRLRDWEAGKVWDRVLRNLEFIKSYDGWLECNTSALRKGLAEPYPAREIAEACHVLRPNYLSY
jgi:histidinol-phosphatase (PHP family)